MKQCPVCEYQMEQEVNLCQQCGWDFPRVLGTQEGSQAAIDKKIQSAKEIWQAARPLNADLPYYDFMLVGHSSAGKTTYLTMLCEQGGNGNNKWNFRSGGSALDVGDNAPQAVRNAIAAKDAVVINLIRDVARGTQTYINLIRTLIKNKDPVYTTAKDNKLVFSFRPRKQNREHTLLTFDYPGEWISIDTGKHNKAVYKSNIEKVANYLTASQSLIIMVDAEVFANPSKNSEKELNTLGLSDVQEQLRANTNRPKEFVPVRKIPVALVLNKMDRLSTKDKQKPKAFVKKYCNNIYSSLNNFTDNWKPFFISCYGVPDLKPSSRQGGYVPPENPQPENLVEPLEWLYKQTRKRKWKGIVTNFSLAVSRFVLLPLAIMAAAYYGAYYSIYTWDHTDFSEIENTEPSYLDKPAELYRTYTDYDDKHWFSAWTGFKQNAFEKRKGFVGLYLRSQLDGVLKHSSKLSDFADVRSQVRQWTRELSDPAFSQNMESLMNNELMPLYAKQYYLYLRDKAAQNQDIKKEFLEFVQLFPEARYDSYTKALEKLDDEIWALELYKQIYAQINGNIQSTNARDLLGLCLEYLDTPKTHSHTYDANVKKIINFIGKELLQRDGNNLSPRKFKVKFHSYTLSDDMYGEHQESYQEPYSDCYPVKDGWSTKTQCDTRYRPAIRTIRNDAHVVLSVLVDGIERYTLDTSEKPQGHFTIDWMPGMVLELILNNTTGASVRTKDAGMLAINLLRGNVNFDNRASLGFEGSKLSLPKIEAPASSPSIGQLQ